MALIFNSLLLDAIFVLVLLSAILYFYMTRNFNYWEKRGVHSIYPKAFFGSIASVILLRESIGCWLARKYKETSGKRFFGAYFMDKPVLVIRDLELVKNVLVKDAHAFIDRLIGLREDLDPLAANNIFAMKGRKWHHLRVKLSPTFTSGKMKKMFYLVDEGAKLLVSCLEKNASSGDDVDVKDIMTRYTADVIASCAFGVNTNSQLDKNSEFLAVLRRVFERNGFVAKIVATLIMILPNLVSLFKLKTVDADIEDYVRKLFWDVVDERKKTGMVKNDFMDLMIKLKDDGEVRSEEEKYSEEIKNHSSYSSTQISKNEQFNFEMKDDVFVAQAFTFLLAGLETSSAVLNYSLYELALNLDIQDKLRDEIIEAIDKNNGKITYEDVTGMLYLEMVVSETLRKYPTLAFLERACQTNYNVPGTDVVIQKGTQIIIPVLGIHMDPEIYPDPEKYDPERFRPENKNSRSKYSHLPFGEGPRICIGMRFGQMQVKTALIHILASYEVRPCAETPKPPLHYKPGTFTHVPEEKIVLAFKKLM